MLVVFVATVLFVLAGTSVHGHSAVPIVVVSAFQFLVGAGLYFLSARLERRFIRVRSEALRTKGVPVEDFSAPAVPRWVVEMANVGFGAILSAVLPLVESVAP